MTEPQTNISDTVTNPPNTSLTSPGPLNTAPNPTLPTPLTSPADDYAGIEADQLSVGPIISNSSAVINQPAAHPKKHWLIALLALLLFGAGISVAVIRIHQLERNRGTTSTGYNTVTVPLQNFSQDSNQMVSQIDSLTVTGKLNVNGYLRLAPNNAPAAPLIGQVYYDQTSNRIQYYDGTSFLEILNSQDGAIIDSRISQALGVANSALAASTSNNTTTNNTVNNSTGDLTVAGTLTVNSLGIGLVQSNASGVLSSGTLSRNDSLLTDSLDVAKGGTGQSFLTSHSLLYGNGAGPVGLAGGSSGQLLLIDNSGVPGFVTASGDALIGTTGAITIASGAVTNSKLANSSLTIGTSGGITGGGAVALGGSLSLGLANTVCTTSNPCPVPAGSGYYIQNGVSTQSSANFNIDGTGQAANLNATATLQAPVLDTASATTLNIAGTNATLVNIGRYTVNTFIGGNLTVNSQAYISALDAVGSGNNLLIGTNLGGAGTANVIIGRYEVPTIVQGPLSAWYGLRAGYIDTVTSGDSLRLGTNFGASTTASVLIGHYEVPTNVQGPLSASQGFYADHIDAASTNGTIYIGASYAPGTTAAVVLGDVATPVSVQGGFSTNYLTVPSTLQANSGLVQVANLNFMGTTATTFTTPQTSVINTRIAVPLYDPGNFNQVMALGLPNGSSVTSRVISVFDDRSANDSNQPPIALFSPSETNIMGLSWDGQSDVGYIKLVGASNPSLGFKLNSTVVAVLDVSGNFQLTNGHIISGSTAPGITAGAAACTSPTVSVSGTDTAGTVTVTTGSACAAVGTLATVNFGKLYSVAPKVTLTPRSAASAQLLPYNGTTGTSSFSVDASVAPTNATTYTFNYIVIQ